MLIGLRILHNGIDVQRFCVSYGTAKIAELKKEFGIKEGPVIGIIARLSSVKGHKFLIEAFSLVLKQKPDTQLFIVGGGPEENNLIAITNKLKIDKNVIFHKPVSETIEPLLAMDIFVMPSIQEGLGLSIMEAMAAGKPVIASNVGGISTLVKDRVTGFLVPPADPQKLAETILYLLNNKAMQSNIAGAAKKYVVENFNLQDMVSKVERVYEEVLKKRV